MNVDIRYLLGWVFALVVFAASFYGIVLYEFNLDELKTGWLISVGTLAVQWALTEVTAYQQGKRAVAQTEAATKSSNGHTTTSDG